MDLPVADLYDRARAEWLVDALRRTTATDQARFRPSAFDGVAMGVVVAGRELDLADLSTLAKLGVWVCGFDDLVDATTLTDAEIAQHIDRHLRIVAGATSAAEVTEPCARLFARIQDELRGAPAGPRLWALWMAQVGDALRAMAWERGVRAAIAAGRAPTLDHYLARASRSICVELMVTAAAMLIGEPRASGSLGLLRSVQHRAALVVRLANDLATWPREQLEGSGNALALVGEARAPELRARLSDERAQLAGLLPRLRDVAPATAGFLERLVEYFLVVYGAGDLCSVARAA